MTLYDLADGTRLTIAALLARVPFEAPDLERTLNLPRGSIAAAQRLQLSGEPGERLAGYLARYVVEGAIVDTDIALWDDTPTGPEDSGMRLYIRCPSCRTHYVLGGVNQFALIDTKHRDDAGLPINLVYYRGDTVQCPAAKLGSFCTSPAREWAPWPVRVHPSVSAVEAL